MALETNAARGGSNQFCKALPARFFLLRTYDPPNHHFAIGRCLHRKVFPGGLVAAHFEGISSRQIFAPLLIRVDGGLVFDSEGECFKSGWLHSFLVSQDLHSSNIGFAPDAAFSPWGEANG